MTSLTYIVESTPWIVVGLLVGFFMGSSTAAVEAIADAVQDEGEIMSDAPVRERRPRFTTTVVLGVVIAVLGVFTAVQSYVQSAATDRLTECQVAYANGFADALDARSSATSEAQNALDEFLSTAAAAVPTSEGRDQVRKALAEYLAKRADAKKAQAEHPFPPAPRDVCKEAGG